MIEYIKARTIVTRNKSNSWFGYEYTMNIYRGCNHGCIYCDSRCSCYRIVDFEQVKAKENALQIIRNDLRGKRTKGVICSGAMSDPYNIYEKELLLTRHSLELINAFGFGIGLITKSCLVARDIDILSDIKEHSPVIVKLTVTTGDDKLCGLVEPNAPLSSERFQTLKKLTSAGVFSGVLLMPFLPFIEDNEKNLDDIIEKAIESGAKFIYPRMGVTLRGNQKEWFYKNLDANFPGVKGQYITQYKNKIYCNSPYTRKLMKQLRTKCDKYGILYDMDEINRKFRENYTYTQLPLF